MMRIPIGLGQPAVEAIELIASGDKVVMSVKAPGVPGGYEVLALGAMPNWASTGATGDRKAERLGDLLRP